MHGVQQGLQHGGRAYLAHAKPSQTSRGTGELTADIRSVVQVSAVHADIPQARRTAGQSTECLMLSPVNAAYASSREMHVYAPS